MIKTLLLSVTLLFLGCQSSNTTQKQQKQQKQQTQKIIKNPTTNIKPNQTITSGITIELNSLSLWLANEGELATATLIDANNNTLGVAILRVTDGNWMSKDPLKSKGVLKFKTQNTQDAKLIFKNNNPSISEGENKHFSIAVKLPKKPIHNPLVGDWYQLKPTKPFLKSFTLRADGTAKSINMATFQYQSYKRDADKIIFSIKSIGNGQPSTDSYRYKIESLSSNKMILREIYRGKVSKVKETYAKSH